MKSLLLILFLSLTLIFNETRSEKVLVLCPMCSRSHKNVIEGTVEGLVKRNHSITIVSSFKTSIKSTNIRDIIVMDGFDYFAKNPLAQRSLGMLGMMDDKMVETSIAGCHATYQHPEFLKLLNQSFDLVIMDAFCNHCLQGFIYRLGAPSIMSMPLPSSNSMSIIFGNYLPPSFVPDMVLPFSSDMNLLQRFLNFVAPKIFWTYYFSFHSVYEQIYKTYLGEDIPGIHELEANMSMMLINGHFSINQPRPSLPDMVEIGGVHCRDGRPLPQDLEDYITGAKDGVILFSLGSIFKGGDMPEETRKAFVDAFSKVKQRVIWKWDGAEMSDLPKNVKLSKWLPVQDILAHPNTKLFMTHGGLLSTQEAIYHGVPLVGIPLFGDQDLNVNRYVDMGLAVSVEILGLTEKVVSDAINTVLSDPKYRNKVEQTSRLFRDQPMSAQDTAVFWSEYVMRHKGAPELRSVARQLTFIQYHSLDVIAILFAIVGAALGSTVFVMVKLYKKCFFNIPIAGISPKKKRS